MSRIRANNIVNGAGTGAPTFPNGAIINGITTITADVATTGSNLTIGTGTTISNPSDNEFRILTNGGERVRVDSSGNVGIGTEEPTKALHISQNSDVAIRLQARNANVDNTSWEIVVGGNASNDAEMVFRTRNDAGTGGSEIARFTTGGDLKFPSGGGIDFSATADGSGTVTSEIFDDYEEGTWTPGWAASGTVTTDVANGNYTKIGDLCFLSFIIGSTGTPTLTDTISVTGVPFTIDTTTNIVRYQGSFEAIFFLVNSTTSYSLAPTSNVTIGIRETSNGGGNTNCQWNDVQAVGSFEIRGTIVYKVA